ncbi:MAG: hypothetical protein IKQ66_05590 [Treponema sp.]|nr:hypothetical protein [Treponema sp.]
MKKVLAKAACVAFVFVTGLAFVACPNNVNGPSSGSGVAPAETLEKLVGVNPFKGKKYSQTQYEQYRFKDSDECIVEHWIKRGSSSNFELTVEYKYTYDTEKNTLTLAKNRVQQQMSDEVIDVQFEYQRKKLEYQYATLKGETATQPTSPSSQSSWYGWYTYSEFKAQYQKVVDKWQPLYDEYIAKFEALLNDSQYAGKKTQIEADISNLKQEKQAFSASSMNSVVDNIFGEPDVYKYAVNGTSLTLTQQWSGKLESKNGYSLNARSASGIVSLSNSGSSLYFSGNGKNISVYNFTISNGTISGTYNKSQSGGTTTVQIPVSLAYSTTGSGNDTKLKINFTNAPDDLKALVENAAELEFSYVPTVINWTEITE